MKLRILLIALAGTLLTWITWRSAHRLTIYEAVIWFILVLFGLILLLWTVFIDRRRYRVDRKKKEFLPTVLALGFALAIIVMNYRIGSNFDKPTLLKAVRPADIHGYSIDLKTDGTYIIDDYAIGINEFTYGTYRLEQDRILLDRDSIDGVVISSRLRIGKEPGEADSVFQLNRQGRIIPGAAAFKIRTDNRR